MTVKSQMSTVFDVILRGRGGAYPMALHMVNGLTTMVLVPLPEY